ncbi:MAG: hypothetical protein HYZ31_00540 [Gammaproteobacteria bacterium]|nr:hypothetical protein [Gammaproteobacteria bacterium]
MPFNKYVLTALAAALTTTVQAGDVDINSFLTLGAANISEEGKYLSNTTENISFENDSHYGINLRTQVTDRVSGAAQLLATATDSNFNVDAEWAYLSYQLSTDVSARAGKLNLTTFLLSDYAKVGYLHPWVRPPVEVYNNNPLRNFLGLELLNVNRFGRTAKLTSQIFIGSAQAENGALEMKANDGYGVNFQLDTPSFTIRAGAISPVIQVQAFDPATNSTVELLDEDDRGVMYTVGASVDVSGFVMYTEAVATDTEGQTQGIFPNQKGAYLTLGYNMGKFLPHVTFGTSSGDNYTGPTDLLDPLCGIPGCGAAVVQTPKTQDSVALGLKYTVDDSVAIKFEVQKVDLTAGKGQGFASLEDSAVESFNVISVAMDAIF